MSDTIPDAIAARAEAARIAEHQAALESLRQFGEPLAAPDPVIVIDMRLQAMVEIYDREWQEFYVEASVAFAASAARLRDAREAMVRRLEAEMPAEILTVKPDPITELISIRAWILHRADDIEAIGELPSRRRSKEASRIAERMRNAVSAPHLVEACRR